MKNNVILLFLFPACVFGVLPEGEPTQRVGNGEGHSGRFTLNDGSEQERITVGDKVIFSGLEDPNGLEFVEFDYLWYLLKAGEAEFSPRLVYRMSDTARSAYFNTLPEDIGQYLMLEILYRDSDGFYNRYSVRSAETIAAATDINESQGAVIFDRRWLFVKIPLIVKTDQTGGERYVWRVFAGDSQRRPLALVSGEEADKVISLSAAYADDYGFQTSEEQITLQFEKAGNYYVTLEVFPASGASRNFVSEQLIIQSNFIRGGKSNVADN